MDFHSLSRKELQALCKKNKIPANITNIAMADALKALEKVEGLDEFTTAGPQQSPEKTMSGSPDIPRTQYRTSTQRKTINVEPDSAPLSCTRQSTRRTTVTREADPENKNVNLLETPAKPTTRRRPLAAETKLMESCNDKKVVGQEKSDMPQTPAMQLQTSRKRAPAAASARRRMGPQEEKSVFMASSTRRSVRLLEKSMAELRLKDKGRIDELCKEIEDIEEKRDEPGADLQTVSEESSKKSNDSEVLSCQNIDQLVKNEREMNNEHQEVNQSDGPRVEDLNPTLEMGSEEGNALHDLSGLDTKDVDDDGSLNEAEFLHVENLEKAEDNMNHESSKGNGPGVLITKNSDTLYAAFKSVIDEDLISERSSVNIEAEQVSIVTHHVLATPHQINSMIEQSSKINQDPQFKNAIDIDSDANQSYEVQDNDNADMIQKTDPLFLEDICSEKLERKDESESPHSILRQNEVSDNLLTKSYNTTELPDHCEEDLSAEYNLEAFVDVDVVEADEIDMAHIGNTTWDSKRPPSPVLPLAAESQVGLEIPLSEMTKVSNSNVLVDVPVMPAEEFSIVSYESPPTLDKTPTSVKQKSPYQPQVAAGKATVEIVTASPFAADTLHGQFPRPKGFTPRRPSINASDINKENIDNSSREMESKNDNVKQKVNDEAISSDASLRMLRKMLKEKLQISNKNNDAENVMKVEKTRLALQTLPENMQAAEPETGN